MKVRLLLMAGVALLLVGCTSTAAETRPSGREATASSSKALTETGSPSPSVGSFAWSVVPVAADCADAFKAAEAEAIQFAGAVDTALVQTGVACPNVDEWLSALKARPGAFGMTEQAEIDPQIELSALCYPSRDVPVCHDADARGLAVYKK